MNDTAFCLRCGRSMSVIGESLDPGRPLVSCHWNDGEDHGHGTTLGTRSEAEITGLLEDRRQHRLSQAHVRGDHDPIATDRGQKSRKRVDCPRCAA